MKYQDEDKIVVKIDDLFRDIQKNEGIKGWPKCSYLIVKEQGISKCLHMETKI